MIIHYCAKKNAAFAMHYMLRMFLISCFEAKRVPTNKKIIWVIKHIIILKKETDIINRIKDFR